MKIKHPTANSGYIFYQPNLSHNELQEIKTLLAIMSLMQQVAH